METIYSIRVSYDTPTIPNEKNFDHVESSKISMLIDHEKNALCSGYVVEFIHDATENYYEGGIYACRSCNNTKFPLCVLKVLKLCLFCPPMLIDYGSHKLFLLGNVGEIQNFLRITKINLWSNLEQGEGECIYIPL